MKVAGIILIVLQAISLLGSFANGSIAGLFNISNVYSISKLVGFFLPAIIGIILLTRAAKKNAKKEDTAE